MKDQDWDAKRYEISLTHGELNFLRGQLRVIVDAKDFDARKAFAKPLLVKLEEANNSLSLNDKAGAMTHLLAPALREGNGYWV